MLLNDGDLAKAYTITAVSSDLEVAFLARDMGEGSIIDMTDGARVRTEPLRRDESKGVMRVHADTLQAKLTLVEVAGGRDRELSQEAVMAEEAAQSLISGAQKLFRVSCVLVLKETKAESMGWSQAATILVTSSSVRRSEGSLVSFLFRTVERSSTSRG